MIERLINMHKTVYKNCSDNTHNDLRICDTKVKEKSVYELMKEVVSIAVCVYFKENWVGGGGGGGGGGSLYLLLGHKVWSGWGVLVVPVCLEVLTQHYGS